MEGSMLNLAMLLDDTARTAPDRTAVVLGDERLTYADVEQAASRVANLLASRGVGRGDTVALSCPNLPTFVEVYYGILKVGATVVPLNVLLKASEIAYHLKDSQAKAYVCFAGTADLPMAAEGRRAVDEAPECRDFFVVTARPDDESPVDGSATLAGAVAGQSSRFETVATDPSDTAVILYTSGTTGRPKGAELSHANMVLNALTCNRLFECSPGLADVHLVTLPLFHSFGQTVCLNAGFSVGATLVLMPRFDAAQALALMQREDVTFFAGVPTMYWALLGALTDDVDVGRIAGVLRRAVSGGSALPLEILRQFRERFGVQILEGYGLSETSPVATFSDPGREPRPGSIGVPVWGVDVKLVGPDWEPVDDGVGEIAIRGHNVMKGYYRRPEATAEVLRDGWFRSGDLARRDSDGFYYVVDRAKDMIIRGGFNVYPREVEEILMQHDGVSLAAVVGVPHAVLGEEVKAYVIPTDGRGLVADELVAWARGEMAAYKYPRVVEVVDSLPMTATGKILKRELR
jgi:long-chain acyl-CoA synthetase